MDEKTPPGGEQPSLLQRFYDSPFLLLLAGLFVMFVLFTGWGMVEIYSLPPATLP